MDSLLSDELSQLAKQYSEGLIDKEEYEKKRVEITKRYAIKNAEAAIEALEIQYEAEKKNLSPDERVAMERKIAKAKIALQNMVTSNLVDNVKDREEAEREWLDNIAKNIETVAEFLNGFANLGSALFDRRIQEIEAEQKANQDAHDADIERIERLAETGAISTEEAEARKRAAEDKSAQKEAELAKKKAELQTRQAKFDKANNIAQIALSTAAAIMKAAPNWPLVAITAALGAIQLATAIATPIPKYAKGTKDHGGGLAIVGDGGRSETVITPSGKSFITPSIPTLVDIPKHSMVIPDALTIDDLKSFRSDTGMIEVGKEEGIYVNVSMDTVRIEQGMKDITKMLSKKEKNKRNGAYDSRLNYKVSQTIKS